MNVWLLMMLRLGVSSSREREPRILVMMLFFFVVSVVVDECLVSYGC